MQPRTTAFCNRCKKDVPYHFNSIDHTKQFLLTLASLGLWLPMWLCMTFSPTKMCDQCDSPIWEDKR